MIRRSPVRLRSGTALPTICLAVTGSTAADLARNSASFIDEFPFQELRLDYITGPAVGLDELRSHIQAHPQGIFLATCRTTAGGGRFAGSPSAEHKILLQAAAARFPLVDLSLGSAEALGRTAIAELQTAGAAVILSWHDFHTTGELAAVLDRMLPFAADFYKIVPTANSLRDNLTLIQLLQNETSTTGDRRLVAVSMGEAGIPSRVLGPSRGSGFTFASAPIGEATAPGQIDARTLRDLYRIDAITPATRIYGVAGDPIRSSLSPVMQNAAFAAQRLDAVYLPLLANNPEDLFDLARNLPLDGFSVTMPLKQSILPFLDSVDPLAARMGAVNTVVRSAAGRFTGFNTDGPGVVAPLEQRLNLRGARVLVVGAGGAARAAVFGCLDRGAHVTVASRRPEQAHALAGEAGAEAVPLEQLESLSAFDVLINSTPAGMRGNATELPLAPEQIRAGLVFDLVYNPLETPLLRLARERGLSTISGVEMFVHQGARQFALWTGTPAPVSVMRKVAIRALQP